MAPVEPVLEILTASESYIKMWFQTFFADVFRLVRKKKVNVSECLKKKVVSCDSESRDS